MTDEEKLTLQCPCCEATLVIDRKTGAVLWSSEAKPAKPSASIQELVRKLDDQRQATTERVEREQQALKDRSRILEEKVKESFKRVDPDTKRPLRPIDLD
jgi:flagellar basal body P-ring protein FlgI